MSLKDRYGPWAVIAGASEGTGREFARRLAADGVPSVLIARRQEPLTALAVEIRAESGVECITACVDLAAPDACDRIIEAVGSREVGLFISNAGGDPYGSWFLERDVSDWLGLVQRNVVATLQCSHHFARLMKPRGKGGLLLVNSGACYGGASLLTTYSASKAFMLCLAEGLWAELKPYGIDVLTLVLGRTDTPEYRRFLAAKGLPAPEGAASPEEVAKVGLGRLPHGPVRNWGQEDDVAGYAPNSAVARRERILMIDKARGIGA